MKRSIARGMLAALAVSLLSSGTVWSPRKEALVNSVRAAEGCSLKTLHGSYGYFRSGTTPAGPLAAVGIIVYDGRGSFTSPQTIRRNGVTTSDLFTTPAAPGVYEVDPNCAGRAFLPDGSVFVHFVIVDGGREVFILSLSDANTIYGVIKKIGDDD